MKSTIHRVSVPPQDQQHVDRLGLLYFARPRNDVVLSTIKDSPVLQREGYTQNELEKAGTALTMEGERLHLQSEWMRKRPVLTLSAAAPFAEWVVKKQTWRKFLLLDLHFVQNVPHLTLLDLILQSKAPVDTSTAPSSCPAGPRSFTSRATIE